MRTTKSFSTISYNTFDFLVSKLEELKTKRVIEFYAFIEHQPEKDESKAHKHLYIIPNGQFDTTQLQDYLQEFDKNKPTKPLGILPCRSSKFGDWFLYAIHDKSYLASKGQSREYHYTKDEIITSDSDYLQYLISDIDYSKFNKASLVLSYIKQGTRLSDMVLSGFIPVQQIKYYTSLIDLVNTEKLSRNNKKNHELDTLEQVHDEPLSFPEDDFDLSDDDIYNNLKEDLDY